MTGMEFVHVSKHPLVAQKLSQLRENNLKPKVVRELTRDLSLLLGYEASSDITITKGHQVSKKLKRSYYTLYIFYSTCLSIKKSHRLRVNMVVIKHPR